MLVVAPLNQSSAIGEDQPCHMPVPHFFRLLPYSRDRWIPIEAIINSRCRRWCCFRLPRAPRLIQRVCLPAVTFLIGVVHAPVLSALFVYASLNHTLRLRFSGFLFSLLVVQLSEAVYHIINGNRWK
jgi:hypothetical protein